MRLARKLVIAVLIAVVSVLSVHGYLRVRRLRAMFDREGRRDHQLLGRSLALGMSRLRQASGDRAALAMIDEINAREPEIEIRFVSLGGVETVGKRPMAPAPVLAPLNARREVTWVRHNADGDDTLFTYIPVFVTAAGVGAIELSESRAADMQYVEQSLSSTAIATFIAALACAVAIITLGITLVGRRVRMLCEQADRIGSGDFSRPLPFIGNDEIGDLARAMNQMSAQLERAYAALEQQTAARLAAQKQLEHADRLNTVGKLAAGIAHELGTPLHVITQRAEMIASREVVGEAVPERASIIVDQAHRMTVIIRQLLDFARRNEPHKISHDLAAIVRQTATLLAPLAQKRRCSIVVRDPGTPMRVEVDSGHIQQALANLVVNALDAAPADGAVEITLSVGEAVPPADLAGRSNRWAMIAVHDSGIGIEGEMLEKIFEPFVTTKAPGEGTGLGLSVSYGLVREHGGWIDVASNRGSGSTFTIYLPIGDA